MSRLQKKITALFLAVVMTAAMPLAFGAVAFAAEGDVVTITIFHTNDSHGRVVANSSVIGINYIAAIAAAQPDSILVDAGDTFHGLPFATLSKGADIVGLMNAAGYSVMVPGNHDFNYGYQRLVELADMAEFDVISANVTLDGETILPANTIKEIAGVAVGFFGLTTPDTAYKTNPLNVVDIDWGDLVETAAAQVADLREQGAEIIVCVAHVGLDDSSLICSDVIAEEVEGIDVIIDGHSHSLLPEGVVTDSGVLIASTGEYESNLGVVSIEFDTADGVVVSKTAEIMSKADCEKFEPLEDLTAMIGEITAEQDAALAKVIGLALTALDGARETNRTSETNLGNLIADAMLAETGADIAITNGGGIRATIEEGEITMKDIVTVLPFGNYIVTKYLTGEQIIRILEHGVSAYPEALGGFPHVSGISFVFDPSAPAGERIVDVVFGDENLDPEGEYLVATNDFLAVGGDGFDAYAEAPTENEFSSLEEAVASYIEALGTVNYENEGRIIALESTSEPIIDEPIIDEPIISEPIISEPEIDEPELVEAEENEDDETGEPKPNPATVAGVENEYGASYSWLILVAVGAAGYVLFRKREVFMNR